jgi:diguanylate cyclase (GGDEF)-like protein
MTFDVATLAFAEGFVSFAGGLILLITWWQDRAAWAALWWAAANCGAGVGITLLALHAVLPAYASTIVGPLILDLCAVLAWVAAAIFNRGRVMPTPVLAGTIAWIALLTLTGAYASGQLAVAVGWGISGCLYGAAAIEFWRGRGERLRGRWPMISLLALMAIALFLLTIEFSFSTLALPMASISWLGVIHFVTLVYAVGSAVFLVMMLRGRGEAKHKAAALTDPLTGLPNRRAFMERAERLFARSGRGEIPISLLAFDLDRFKSINDAFGHPAGDQVLRIFANVLSRALRPADTAARIGGEEFALVLPGCGDQAAMAIARRIRDAFQDDARFLNGRRLDATVSVGVATASEPGCSLADVIASADAALYRAKALGRNHVMAADGGSNDSPPSAVTRIA